VSPTHQRGSAATLAAVLAFALPAAFGLSGLLSPAPLAAQERILRYDSEVEILADGRLEVTEYITVMAEGRDIRRGIYRDFPTRYRDRFGNRVRVDLEVLGVERDGVPEAWFTERVSNGVRINTGDDDFLPVPAEYTYTLRYRTSRQLGFFEDHDELYWNAIGTGWAFAIEAGSVEVRLPEPVPVERMGAEGYTGPQGAQGQAYGVEVPGPGQARYALTAPLSPREGFTTVLTFPKGIVQEPSRAQRIGWLLTDNRGVLVAFFGLLALLVFCVRRWRKVGRNPAPGVVIPRYAPPDGRTPAEARYLRRMGYDDRCFSSDLLHLAVAGSLRIHRDEAKKKGEWTLERTGDAQDAPPDLRQILTILFERPPPRPRLFGKAPDPEPPGRIVLEDSNASVLTAARSHHTKRLEGALHPSHFRRNGGSAFLAALLALAAVVLAFLVSGGDGIPLILGIAGIMLITVLAFTYLVRTYTPDGRRLLDEIEGLRLYLSVAEKAELAGMTGPGGPPPLDAERYEALLPFAVALDVEDAWTRKFTRAVGLEAAAEATRRMHWYAGRGPVTDLGSFSKSLGAGLSSSIASASSPPGSSSGSGGGGSSGGGGGGGGGGGR